MHRLRLLPRLGSISWLLIASLLWSQMAVAGHAADCPPAQPPSLISDDCHHGGTDTGAHDSTLCAEHCGAEYSADSVRIPPLVALPPSWELRLPAQRLAYAMPALLWRSDPSRHGPTGHPAAVLLL